ncbi:hypothetical protein K438DRAFT_1069677 [Mycena galopus ATCC 62051]|nr:hypothetical protein K438DRAFT_1069677 [Mycena galopus ATCC 62051]
MTIGKLCRPFSHCITLSPSLAFCDNDMQNSAAISKIQQQVHRFIGNHRPPGSALACSELAVIASVRAVSIRRPMEMVIDRFIETMENKPATLVYDTSIFDSTLQVWPNTNGTNTGTPAVPKWYIAPVSLINIQFVSNPGPLARGLSRPLSLAQCPDDAACKFTLLSELDENEQFQFQNLLGRQLDEVALTPNISNEFEVMARHAQQWQQAWFEIHQRRAMMNEANPSKDGHNVAPFSPPTADSARDTGCKPSFPQYFRATEIFNFRNIFATFPRHGNSAEILDFRIISATFPQYFRGCGNLIPRGCDKTCYIRKEKVNYSERKLLQ